MKYLPIAPIGLLELWDDYPYAFILPQFWELKSYNEFYTSRKFDVAIIDNGVYEEAPMPIELLVKIAAEITADQKFVVLPEKVGDTIGTITLAKQFSSLKFGGDFEPMVCIQGKMLSILPKFRELMYEINAFAVPVSMYRQGWERSGIKHWLNMDDKYWHAFGLDCLLEIPILKKFGFDSVDTSMPFTAAIHSIDLATNPVLKGRKRVNLMRGSFSTSTCRLARHNLEVVSKWCENSSMRCLD